MDRWAGKIAVVTGASSGIGLGIAKALVQHDVVVVGFARRKNKMQSEMQGVQGKGKGKFYAYECDVTDPERVEQAFQWVKNNFGVVHILVNNAGVSSNKKLMDSSRSDWKTLFDINVLGLIDCTKHAAKMMLDANVESCIININSILSHATTTGMNISLNMYPATKYASRAATEVTGRELHGSKIRVTSISPGYVATDIIAASNLDLASIAPDLPALESSDIADAVIYIIGTPQRVHITEMIIRPLGELRY